MVDTRWPNPDEVQAVTAVKRLRRKRVAVYPLHTFVLGVSQHQTIIQGKMLCLMTPAFLAAARSGGWHLPEKIIIIVCIICIIVKEQKIVSLHIFTHNLFLQWESNRDQQPL